jgi:hypothetical protein
MSRGSANTDGPPPVDIHVGQRVRMRRNQIGMSRQPLLKISELRFSKFRNMSEARTASAHPSSMR